MTPPTQQSKKQPDRQAKTVQDYGEDLEYLDFDDIGQILEIPFPRNRLTQPPPVTQNSLPLDTCQDTETTPLLDCNDNFQGSINLIHDRVTQIWRILDDGKSVTRESKDKIRRAASEIQTTTMRLMDKITNILSGNDNSLDTQTSQQSFGAVTGLATQIRDEISKLREDLHLNPP